MLSPDLDFDIRVEELPDDLQQAFDETKAQFFDTEETKRQVFSLIILKRFLPRDAFTIAGGSTVENSVSELISNQLSYWISQFDENLEIDIDLGSFDQEAFNTFQLRLSYAFLDGRLQVTRDGVFTNAYTNTATAASIIGDWTVEYQLSDDGKLRVKVFSKNNNINQNIGLENNAINTGVSLLYTTSFDRFKEFLNNGRENSLDAKLTEVKKNNPEKSSQSSDTSQTAIPPSVNRLN
jgi:hypothetical protein